MQTLKPTAKNSETVTLHFTPAPEGATAEITTGVRLPIVGSFISKDGSYSLPCFETMSDYKWQLNCLLDRLFHPEKYQPEEDVPEHVKQLKAWLSEHCKPESKDQVKSELNELENYISELAEDMKTPAELYIKNYFQNVR